MEGKKLLINEVLKDNNCYSQDTGSSDLFLHSSFINSIQEYYVQNFMLGKYKNKVSFYILCC